jgi:D-sedoheptulose 7-phosphate isomerase
MRPIYRAALGVATEKTAACLFSRLAFVWNLPPMTFDESIAERIRTLGSLSSIRPAIDEASRLILETLRSGRKLLIAGNGGSAAEAAHFSTELIGRYAKNRRSLPAVALSSDGSLLSCIGNDFGFDQVFARQIASVAEKGDLVVVLTSSGESANIVAALREAKNKGLKSVAFLGRGGGKAKGLATCELIVPGGNGAAAQETHLFLIHHFCEQIDAEFSG